VATAEGALSAPPYQVPDSLRQRLDLIHHLIEFGRQVIVVTGAPGSGRTRLLAAVAEEAGPSWRVVQVDATPMLTTHLLLSALTGTHGDAPADQALEAEFAASLDRDVGSGPRCLLLLDDVDDIDDDCAEMLCRLAYGRQEYGGLRVVATALPGAAAIERLEDLAPHPALVHVVDVPPLADADVAALIEAWCEDNALPLEAVIEGGALVALKAASMGNPGRALELLARHLAAVPPRVEPVFSTYELPVRVKRWGGIAIVVCAAIGLIALAVGNRGTPHEASPAIAEPGPKTIELTLPIDATPAPAERSGTPEPLRVEAPAPLPATVVVGEVSPIGQDADVPPPVSARPAEALTAQIDKAPPRPTEAVEPAKKPASVPQLPPTRETGEAVPAPVPAVSASVPYTADWVRRQDKRSFVIQLFGSHSRSAADKFVSQNRLADRAAILDLVHDGRPWYVVVYGLYPQRSAASQAIAGLSAALRAGRPWPRAVSELRK